MALLNTDLLSAHDQTFRQDRYMHESWLQEGVVGAGDYKVTPGGASLQWSSAAGVAWVKGDDTTRQGLYQQINDAAVTGTVATGHATLPRLDQVVLRVFDSSVSGVSDTPTLTTLTGTATSGATLDNRTGAASLPASALLLADVLVPATHSGVLTTAMIRDRRKWAGGAYNLIKRNTASYTTASGTMADLDATNLKPRIECSGLPVRLTLMATTNHSVIGASSQLGFAMDGTLVDGSAASVWQQFEHGSSAGQNLFRVKSWETVPTAGSHTFAPQFAIVTAGTLTVGAAAVAPLVFVVEEIMRQNASNT